MRLRIRRTTAVKAIRMRILPKAKYIRVRMSCKADVRAFRKALDEAVRNSMQTGAIYSVFLPLEGGQKLQIEVGLVEPWLSRAG